MLTKGQEKLFKGKGAEIKVLLLCFDTNLFNKKMGRLEIIIAENKKELNRVLNEAMAYIKKEKYKHITARVDAAMVMAIHELEGAGFRLITDFISMQKQCTITDGPENSSIREAWEGDLDTLIKMTVTAFEGRTRFHLDPFFSYKSANDMYIQWVRNSLIGEAADIVLIYESECKIMGYIAGKLQREEGSITLLAVDKEYEGKGVGGALIHEMERRFADKKCCQLYVGTESINYGALRVYQRCGFRIAKSMFTLHYRVEA